MWITFYICGKERLFVDKKPVFMGLSFATLCFSFIKSQNIRSYPPKNKERVKMKNQKVDKLSTKNKGF